MQTPLGKCEVADAHMHFFSRHFLEALGLECGKDARQVASTLGWEFPGNAEELALKWSDELTRHGVSQAVLIASTPGDEPSVIAAQAVAPERFLAYAMMNPVTQDQVNPGLRAICLFPAMHGYALSDARVHTLLEQVSANRQAVFVHCGVLTVGARKKLGLLSPFDMRFSNPLDLHAVAMRFPNVRFVVPHFGAGFFREALMVAEQCPNVYLDTSSTNAWMRYEAYDLPKVFRRALDVLGASRLLFGTDSSFFPRGWNREVYEVQVSALTEMGISSEDLRLILGENLRRIFAE